MGRYRGSEARARYFANLDEPGYTFEETEFLRAISNYQTAHGRLDCNDPQVLRIAKALGYRKETGRRKDLRSVNGHHPSAHRAKKLHL